MNTVDLKEVIDNLKLPTCKLPGHYSKDLIFVCVDDNCQKCQVRGSKLLCSKCMLSDHHNMGIEDVKDFITQSLYSNDGTNNYLNDMKNKNNPIDILKTPSHYDDHSSSENN